MVRVTTHPHTKVLTLRIHNSYSKSATVLRSVDPQVQQGMIFDVIYAVFNFVFSVIYRTLNQQLVNNFLTFVRGFEFAIILMAAIIFLLIAVSIMLRRARTLPHSYEIQIFDLDGREVTIDGLRQAFSTYDAAESFARQYQKTYVNQYRFKVIGRTSEHKPPPSGFG